MSDVVRVRAGNPVYAVKKYYRNNKKRIDKNFFVFSFLVLPIVLFCLLRNGLFFYIKTIGWSLIGTIMLVLPVGLLFVPLMLVWVKYIVLVLFVIFVFPIIFLVMVLYSTSKFDVYINQDNYPDYFMRGLNY